MLCRRSQLPVRARLLHRQNLGYDQRQTESFLGQCWVTRDQENNITNNKLVLIMT